MLALEVGMYCYLYVGGQVGHIYSYMCRVIWVFVYGFGDGGFLCAVVCYMFCSCRKGCCDPSSIVRIWNSMASKFVRMFVERFWLEVVLSL